MKELCRLASSALPDVGLSPLHLLIAHARYRLNIERSQGAALTAAVAMSGHATAPSGHAAVVRLLAGLPAPLQPNALARECVFAAVASMAANRELAVVHFAIDSQAGQALGFGLASWLKGLAVGRAPLGSAFNLDGGALPAFTGFAAAKRHSVWVT